ncbi:MAG: hypothetical protein AAGB11_14645 [Pseudomonadota bacterium]
MSARQSRLRTFGATLFSNARLLLKGRPSQAEHHISAIETLIDEAYYFHRYPEAHDTGMSAAEHYVYEGWRVGADPAPWFSSEGYLAINSDVAGNHMPPFVHYALFGRRERRTIMPTDGLLRLIDDRPQTVFPVRPDLRALRSREENNWDTHITDYTLRRLASLER